MVMFWVAILAVSILLYVLLDGFDLGVGILFGLTSNEARRHAMMSAVAPMWDGNETWLVVAGVILWGAFPVVYATLFSAFYVVHIVADEMSENSCAGTSTAPRNSPMRSMMRASAWYSPRSRYHAPVPATQDAPVRYEANSMCGKRTQTTGLNNIAVQSSGAY